MSMGWHGWGRLHKAGGIYTKSQIMDVIFINKEEGEYLWLGRQNEQSMEAYISKAQWGIGKIPAFLELEEEAWGTMLRPR